MCMFTNQVMEDQKQDNFQKVKKLAKKLYSLEFKNEKVLVPEESRPAIIFL